MKNKGNKQQISPPFQRKPFSQNFGYLKQSLVRKSCLLVQSIFSFTEFPNPKYSKGSFVRGGYAPYIYCEYGMVICIIYKGPGFKFAKWEKH